MKTMPTCRTFDGGQFLLSHQRSADGTGMSVISVVPGIEVGKWHRRSGTGPGRERVFWACDVATIETLDTSRPEGQGD